MTVKLAALKGPPPGFRTKRHRHSNRPSDSARPSIRSLPRSPVPNLRLVANWINSTGSYPLFYPAPAYPPAAGGSSGVGPETTTRLSQSFGQSPGRPSNCSPATILDWFGSVGEADADGSSWTKAGAAAASGAI